MLDDQDAPLSAFGTSTDLKATRSRVISPPETIPAGSSTCNGSQASMAPHEHDESDSSKDSTPTTSTTIPDLVQLVKTNRCQIQEAEVRLQALLAKQQALLQAQRCQEVDAVLAALATPLGFHKGRPVPALLLYHSLWHWGAFQPSSTSVSPQEPSLAASPDYILGQVLDAITQQMQLEDRTTAASRHDRMVHLATWLSNLAALLYLLQSGGASRPRTPPEGSKRNIQKVLVAKMEGLGRRLTSLMDSAASKPALLRAATPLPASLPHSNSINSATRLPGSASAPPAGATPSESIQDAPAASEGGTIRDKGRTLSRASSLEEALPAFPSSWSVGAASTGAGSVVVSPAVSSLRQGLEDLGVAAYRALREAAKRQLAGHLGGCMLVPQDAAKGSYTLEDAEPVAPGEEKLMAMRPWCAVVSTLNEVLETLHIAHAPRPLCHALFGQLLMHINATLFNQLLLRPECCSTSNAKYVVEGLTKVDAWVLEVGQEALGPAFHCLHHIRQASTLLIVENKCRLTVEDLRDSLCPALNEQQLYRLCTTFWDDAGATETVSGEVLEALKAQVPNNGGLIVTFLLEEDPGVPFAPRGQVLLELLAAYEDQELLQALPIPPVLLEGGVPGEVYSYLEEELQLQA